jgi:hypothetical protein
MAIEVHVWKISGTSPLMLNNPAETMASSDDGLRGGKKTYDDKEEAEIRTYRDKDKHFIYTTAGFRAAMLTAAAGRKIGKRTAKQALAGAVFPVETEFLILDDKEKPIKGYEIDKRRVVIGKSAVLRCRPRFSPWCCKLPLEIDTDFVTNLGVVTEILNIAGRIVGIGELRPDTSKGRSGIGNFGRFSATLVK